MPDRGSNTNVFPDELYLTLLSQERFRRRLFELHERFRYYADNHCIEVPAGYTTDFASIPWLFWRIFPPIGRYARAAVIHDWLCDQNYFRPYCDAIFLQAMRTDGVRTWKRYVIYWACRLWGIMTLQG